MLKVLLSQKKGSKMTNTFIENKSYMKRLMHVLVVMIFKEVLFLRLKKRVN